MTEDPHKSCETPATGGAEAEAEGEHQRPTVNPPFDVEAFARRTASDEPRPADSDVPTRPPPAPGVPELEDDPLGRQITLTNEVELEKARALSAVPSDPPEPRRTLSGPLSIADARAPSVPSGPPTGGHTADARASERTRASSPASTKTAVANHAGHARPPRESGGMPAGSPSAASGPEITEHTIEDAIGDMRERFALGDYSGALETAELILAEEPGNAEVAQCAEDSRAVLESMFVARVGPLDRVPVVVVPLAQMRWLSMDHRAGFILSLIDGSSSVEMILDVSGMPRLDALRILHELTQLKVVVLR